MAGDLSLTHSNPNGMMFEKLTVVERVGNVMLQSASLGTASIGKIPAATDLF